MATDLGICNSALIKLGVEPITALNEDSKQANLCNEQYEKIRDALLYDHPWNFAMKWYVLDENGNSHDNPEYLYEFDLPDDYFRVWNAEWADEDFEVMDNLLYADSATIKVKILNKVTDPAKFSPAFAEALALKLASDLEYALVQSNSFKVTLLQEMEQYLPRVRSADAQENPAKSLEQDVFINSRW